MAERRSTVVRRALRALALRLRERIAGPRLPWKTGDLVDISFGDRGGGKAPVGVTVLQAAKDLRISLDHFCGGRCSCGTCRVVVHGERTHLSAMDLNEEVVLGATAVRRGDRLACQAVIHGPVEVEIPRFFNA